MSLESTLNSPADRQRNGRQKDPQKSAITNGRPLPGLGRSAWVRRAKDLLAAHIADLGGDSNISQAERVLLRRCVTLIVELERREMVFAQAGAADDEALAIYQTTVNTLRRTLEALGLKRRPREVSGSFDNDDPALQAYRSALAEIEREEAQQP